MKKQWVYGAAVAIMLGSLATACSSKEEAPQGDELGALINTSAVQTSAEAEVKTTGAGSGPVLEAQLVQDGRNATLTYQVSQLQLSAENMGKGNVAGEGHLHLYVDGKQKAMLNTNAPVKLTNLSAGKHVIKLELQQNDHSSLNVHKEFNIEVK